MYKIRFPQHCGQQSAQRTVAATAFFFFFFFFFVGGRAQEKFFMGQRGKKKKLCWNHQIWYNFNTFEITFGGKLGQENILGGNAPTPTPINYANHVTTPPSADQCQLQNLFIIKKIYIIFISNCPKDSKKWYIFINHCPKGWQEMRWCNYNNYKNLNQVQWPAKCL